MKDSVCGGDISSSKGRPQEKSVKNPTHPRLPFQLMGTFSFFFFSFSFFFKSRQHLGHFRASGKGPGQGRCGGARPEGLHLAV